MKLSERHCVPCRGGVPALKGENLVPYVVEVPGWKVIDEHHLSRTFTFPDFRSALEFVNRAGAVAEAEGHHPDLCLSWGRVEASVYTHAVDGLTESDFILAAKLDQEYAHHKE